MLLSPSVPATAPFTTPDGRTFEVDLPAPQSPTTPPVVQPGATSLAAAGFDRQSEFARFTNVQDDDTAWQVHGGARYDEAIPLAGSFRDAVAAARSLAKERHLGRSWFEPTFAIVAGAEGVRHAVELRGYLKPDRLYGESNVREVFVTEAQPAIEALVSASRWIDLRADAPGETHEPTTLRVVPFIGPIV